MFVVTFMNFASFRHCVLIAARSVNEISDGFTSSIVFISSSLASSGVEAWTKQAKDELDTGCFGFPYLVRILAVPKVLQDIFAIKTV